MPISTSTPAFKLAALAVITSPAVNRDEFETGIAADQFGVTMNLHRQLAGGRQDDGPGTDRALGDGGFHQMMQGG